MGYTTQFILHIGYPKTGTTTLQNNLFDIHPEIENIGKPFSHPSLDVIQQICKEISNTKSNLFEHNFNKHKYALRKIFNNCTSKKIVLSHEHLIGYWNKHSNDYYLFKRIYDLFYYTLPKTCQLKILLTIRNQQNLALSSYVEKKFSLFNDYNLEKFMYEGTNNPYETIIFKDLFFMDKVKTIEKFFSKERIYILVYEDLKHDLGKFCSNISRIFDIDSSLCYYYLQNSHDNKKDMSQGAYATKITLPSVILKKLRKHTGLKLYIRHYKIRSFVKKILNYTFFNLGIKQENNLSLSTEEKREILLTYKENNIKLLKRYDLDLEKYDYI